MFPTATLYISTEIIWEDKDRKKILQKKLKETLFINAATQQNTENMHSTKSRVSKWQINNL